MYILKNAWKSIVRSKGRNILIGIIIFAISVSACLGLSIRQAAESAKDDAFAGVTITAQISVDRSSMMSDIKNNMEEGAEGGFDKDSFASLMSGVSGLTVEEMLEYAESEYVADFYYTLTVSMNGSDEFEAVDSNSGMDMNDAMNGESSGSFDSLTGDDESSDMSGMDMPENDMPGMSDMMGGGKGFQMGSMGTQGDFTVIGYSSDAAMTDFINGTSTITEGTVFDEGTEKLECIISSELATYNSIEVGDTVIITNPNDEDETYELTVVGIFENSQSTVTSGSMMAGFSTSTDPANQIYLSYTALKSITTASSENATVEEDEDTGITTTTALPEQESGTYVFDTVDDYEAFEKAVYEMGLDESYIVSSSDVSSYEQSVVPLENLSEMATYFLVVVLAIGAVVLIVLNIFSVRERKYEVGVLTAIGMKKYKVSIQFMLETLIIAVFAVFLGGVVGAVSAVPVTNSLLASQIEASSSTEESQESAFGRETGMMSGDRGGMQGGNMQRGDMLSGNKGGMDFGNVAEDLGFGEDTVEYISEVSSATNLTVLLQLMLIGIGLTVVASLASIIFIMRYDPLKILSNRD